MQEQSSGGKAKLITGIVAVAILVIVIAAAALNSSSESARQDMSEAAAPVADEAVPESHSQNSAETSQSAGEPANKNDYKNGIYDAIGTYLSPGGAERIVVNITIKDDTVTAAEVEPQPASPTSTQFQGEFAANFRPLVVGKDIDSIKLSRVAGSSLTSSGFNEALEEIRRQARS